MAGPTIVWFRQDLRITDNPALRAALARGPVVQLYIHDDATPGAWKWGGASRWWLHHSLASLGRSLRERGGALVLRQGPAESVLDAVIAETGADAVAWNRCYEPFAIERDTRIKAALTTRGLAVESHNAALLHEPWTITNKSGEPYKVYTQFWKSCLARGEPDQPLPAPARIAMPARMPRSETLEGWGLLPTRPDWAGGLRESWNPGEVGAAGLLDAFLSGALGAYRADRDRPDLDVTSRLSPHLHWGEISPRQIWHRTRAVAGASPGVDKFFSELGWREFSAHLLFHFRDLPLRNLRRDFDSFPWSQDAGALRIWQRGRTGYPIVDAGMRQLWRTGWMHNRVRMIVASFLVKDLLVPWQDGAAWFWDTLVDADLANNSASWQWVAGCGADAAPYFRVFNPVLQGEKFDPSGDYVRRYVPELARLPNEYVHQPWAAPADVLQAAGVVLGATYPNPIVDHGAARTRALNAFGAIRNAA
jgi:deoxyribodipyrimidine photo-lyase